MAEHQLLLKNNKKLLKSEQLQEHCFRKQANKQVQTDAVPSRAKRLIRWLCVGLFVLCLIWLWLFFTNSQRFPISKVTVEASYYHLQPKALTGAIEPEVRGGFFALSMSKLRHRLLQMPWVAEASARRVWPGQLVIKVVEKKPLAVWNKGALLSDKGQVFKPPVSTFPKGLPILDGPAGSQKTVLREYKRMNTILSAIGLQVATLTLNARHSWHMIANNGMAIELGRLDINSHLQRFVAVFNKLFGLRANQISYVDLRYTNGFAVRWRA